MVICKYFLNGSCRFNAKCVNEHIDVKAIIKTEVESALKGSQWPLSCFGPFKEKPCIPNFIEDQSFEEIRYLCYEAKKQNCFPAFHQQFTQQVMDAQNKMKALLTLNPDVVEVVTNLYNSSSGSDGTTSQSQSSPNPFSLAGNANSNQSSSLFGPNQTPQSNPFSNTVSSGDNGGGGSLFGVSNVANGGSVFGGQSSLFGSGQGQQQGSLFAQQPNSFSQSGGNDFAMGAQQQHQQQPQSSIFGGTSNVAGNTQQNSSQTLFGNTTGTGFAATTQPSLFGQPQQQQQPLSGGNLFTQAAQPSSGFGAFGLTQPQQTTTFGGQQPTSTAVNASAGLFSQQQPQSNQSAFATSQSGLFGQVQAPQPSQQQNAFGVGNQQQSNNLFGIQQQQNSLASAFGNVQQQGTQQSQNTLAMSTFGSLQQPQQQQQPGNLFGQVQQQQAVYGDVPISENLYSKMDALRPEEIDAFKADKFEIGKIPTNPPPKELVQFK